jgi:hypothetical protein
MLPAVAPPAFVMLPAVAPPAFVMLPAVAPLALDVLPAASAEPAEAAVTIITPIAIAKGKLKLYFVSVMKD